MTSNEADKKALELVEKRVRCVNRNYLLGKPCPDNCSKCEYALKDGEEQDYARALERIWKIAKSEIERSSDPEKCKKILPCGICEVTNMICIEELKKGGRK